MQKSGKYPVYDDGKYGVSDAMFLVCVRILNMEEAESVRQCIIEYIAGDEFYVAIALPVGLGCSVNV